MQKVQCPLLAYGNKTTFKNSTMVTIFTVFSYVCVHGSLQESEQEITVEFHIKIRMDSRVSIQYLIARLILPFLI